MKTIRVRYNRADIRGLGPDCRLLPEQVNDVPLEVWRKFESHPQILGLIDDGSIELLDDPDALEGDEPAQTAQEPATATEPKGKAPRTPRKPKPAQEPAPAPTQPTAPAPTGEGAAVLAGITL